MPYHCITKRAAALGAKATEPLPDTNPPFVVEESSLAETAIDLSNFRARHHRFDGGNVGKVEAGLRIREKRIHRMSMISHIHSALEFSAQIPRYTEILRVLFKYGFSDVLKLLVLQRIVGIEASEMPTHDSGLFSGIRVFLRRW